MIPDPPNTAPVDPSADLERQVLKNRWAAEDAAEALRIALEKERYFAACAVRAENRRRGRTS